MAQENQLQLKIDPAGEAGSYANAISIHVNPAELAIDFAYLLPGSQPPTLKVVSRVNVTLQTAESLMEVLGKALKNAKESQK